MPVSVKRRIIPDVIVIEIDEHEARELANYLDGTDMHLGVHDRMKIAQQIKQALAGN